MSYYDISTIFILTSRQEDLDMAMWCYLSLYLINNFYLMTDFCKSSKGNYPYISIKYYYGCSEAII